MKSSFAIIAAVDAKFGIGKNRTLPWHLPADLKHFKNITTLAAPDKKNVVIMGRKTWESLPSQFQPLPGRVNLVLSRQPRLALPAGVIKAGSLDAALLKLSQGPLLNSIDGIFVIGGEEIFRQSIVQPSCRKVYLTHLLRSFDCDCFFPQENLFEFRQVKKSNPAFDGPLEYFFAEYERI